MKRIISLILVFAMLLTIGCISAFADGEKTPTSGPWTGFNMMFGGARVGFSNFMGFDNKYVVNSSYDTGELVINNDAMPGATYDKSSNTLTLEDLDASDYSLFIWYMGDDFKLKVVGNCSVAVIYVYDYMSVYSSSLNIIGTGKLTINEKKLTENAIRMFSENEKSTMKLSIAASVSIDAYAAPEEGGTPVVINVGGAGYDTAAKAASAGGAAIEGIKSKRVSVTRNDYINVAVPQEGEYITYAYEARSKTDPDGIYSASEQEDEDGSVTSYWVKRYIRVPGYDDMYTVDMGYGEYGGMQYSVDDFNKGFTLVTEPQPKEMYVTSEWREKNLKGESGVKMIKNDDPEGIYIGSPAGTWEPYSYEDPQGYYIYRVVWDDSEGMYVQDTGFKAVSVKTTDLAAKGYEVAYETVDEIKTMEAWVLPAPYEEPNWCSDYELLRRDSDPDGIYIRTGTYYTEGPNGERINPGISVNKVFYDEENGAYYTDIYSSDPEIDFQIPDTDMESGVSEFTYITESVQKQISLRFIPENYEFWQHAKIVYELQKDDDPDGAYCYQNWTTTEDGVTTEHHTVYELTYNEADGHYYIGGDETHEAEGTDMTFEEMEDAGFTVVTEPKPVDLVLPGRVITTEAMVYTDNNGKKYIFEGYPEKAYAVDESRSFVNGGETYYFVTEAPDVKKTDLNDNSREELVDAWDYWLEEAEYHFQGSGQEASVKVSGSIKSFLDKSEVTVKLTGTDNDFIGEAKGTDSYSIENVPAGKYEMTVSKVNHVTRTYEIEVVDADVTANVKIHPRGDITGDGLTNAADCAQVLRSVRKLEHLDAYQTACGDLNNTKTVDAGDAAKMLRHLRKIEPLY